MRREARPGLGFGTQFPLRIGTSALAFEAFQGIFSPENPDRNCPSPARYSTGRIGPEGPLRVPIQTSSTWRVVALGTWRAVALANMCPGGSPAPRPRSFFAKPSGIFVSSHKPHTTSAPASSGQRPPRDCPAGAWAVPPNVWSHRRGDFPRVSLSPQPVARTRGSHAGSRLKQKMNCCPEAGHISTLSARTAPLSAKFFFVSPPPPPAAPQEAPPPGPEEGGGPESGAGAQGLGGGQKAGRGLFPNTVSKLCA